jgi:hypothetical protein
MYRRGFLLAPLITLPLATARASASAPVVLELFTSQGCSSCPPADALLGRLIQEAGVIGLSWHVDYWDRLGWRDPYARREWTERQKTYADRLNAEVFTPGLVVNGTAMLVGSDETRVRRAIADAAPLPTAVTAHPGPSGLNVAIGPVPAAGSGLLAIYDPEHLTEIGAGENDGRRLREYRVVREIRPLGPLAPSMNLPPVPDGQGAVVLLRDANWRVVGAADLPPARPA